MCACFQQDEKQYFATKSSPFPGSVRLLNLPPPKKTLFLLSRNFFSSSSSSFFSHQRRRRRRVGEGRRKTCLSAKGGDMSRKGERFLQIERNKDDQKRPSKRIEESRSRLFGIGMYSFCTMLLVFLLVNKIYPPRGVSILI